MIDVNKMNETHKYTNNYHNAFYEICMNGIIPRTGFNSKTFHLQLIKKKKN